MDTKEPTRFEDFSDRGTKKEVAQIGPDLVRDAATALEIASRPVPMSEIPQDRLRDSRQRQVYKKLAKALRDSIREV
jgi:hypothetical protein